MRIEVEVWPPGQLVHIRNQGPGDAGCWRIIRAVVSARQVDGRVAGCVQFPLGARRPTGLRIAYDLVEVHSGRMRTLAEPRLRACTGRHLLRGGRVPTYMRPASATLAAHRDKARTNRIEQRAHREEVAE
jgi:hypothetical protein